MQSHTSGGRTTCVCDMNSAVPILDLICGILSKFCVYIFIVIIIFFSLAVVFDLQILFAHSLTTFLFLFFPSFLSKTFSFQKQLVTTSCVFSFIGFGISFQYFLIWCWGIFFGLTMILLALRSLCQYQTTYIGQVRKYFL